MAERTVDLDMQAEGGDPAILRVPIPVDTGATEEWVQRVDRRLSKAKPVAQRADIEGDLQLYTVPGDLAGVGHRGAHLLLVDPGLRRGSRTHGQSWSGDGTSLAGATTTRDVSAIRLVHHTDTRCSLRR